MSRFSNISVQTSHTPPAMHYEKCPAKTRNLGDGTIVQGQSVLSHCLIVGEIARCLMSRFPQSMRDHLFPQGSEMVAGSHDIGKISPTFVAKILKACGTDYNTMPELARVSPDLEKQWGGHAGVSQATAEEIGVPKFVAEILGQHHGFTPPADDKRGYAEVFGGPQWFEERKKLVAALKAHFQTDWPTFDSAAQARVVAGLTSVADWIGSGEFFENPDEDWRPIIATALNDAGFIKPVIRQGLSFADVFAPENHTMQMREPQALFVEQVTGPGVYILEAQMGITHLR